MASNESYSYSEERTNFLRVVVLLLEEGLAVLQYVFDTEHPAADLQTHLSAAKADLGKHQGKALNQDQWDKLFPSQGGNVSSRHFDITLLVFLLTFPTNQKPPLPVGWSVLAADIRKNIKKLQTVRNDVYAHVLDASLSKRDFEAHWKNLKKIILRLGNNQIPGLEERISNLRTQPLDQASEELYKGCKKSIEDWIEMDTLILQELHHINTTVDNLTTELNVRSKNLQDAVRQVDRKMVEQEQAMAEIKDNQTEIKAKVMELEKRSSMDPILLNMRAHTRITLASFDENKGAFAKLSTFEHAQDILRHKRFLVLSGNPGEGKSTTAMHLLLRNSSPERCLIIKDPSDWQHVDPRLFDFIVIEDIFGKGNLNASWLETWLPRLDDMWRASRGTGVSFIITSRMHVLDECKRSLRKSRIFSAQHMLHLSSVNLSMQEKAKIFEKHLCHVQKYVPDDFIARCVEAHSDLLGFPECAALFCEICEDESYETLKELGPEFFEKPLKFIQDSIAELYETNIDKFLALVVVWSAERGQLKLSDLVPNSPSNHLKRVAEICGLDLDRKTINMFRKTLDSHKEGILRFHKMFGEGYYSYRHKCISDIVGLLYCKDYPDFGIELASIEFVMEFTVLDDGSSDCPDFSFLVPEYLFTKLAKRFLSDITQMTLGYGSEAADTFKIAVHHALSDHLFVQCVLKLLKEVPEAPYLLEKTSIHREKCHGTEHVMSDVTLVPFCLIKGHVFFVREVLKRKILDLVQDKKKVFGIKAQTLFFALKKKEDEIVELLIAEKAVDGNCLCWTIENRAEDLRFLKKMLVSEVVNSKAKLFHGKTALIVAAQYGNIDTVMCLLEHGADVNARQDQNEFTALHRAIIHKHTEVAKLLIEKGAKVNFRGGNKKKTALHFAAEFGLDETVRQLLSTGVSHLVRDRKGHTPLHLAAKSGHQRVVQILLEKDPSIVNIKAISHAKHTRVKGTTALHYAAMHGYIKILDLLLHAGANPNQCNNFGQTPFYTAAAFGRLEAVRKLAARSEIELADNRGFTPFHAAVYNQHQNVVEYLTDKVDINAKDRKGKAPIHAAVQAKLDAKQLYKMSEVARSKQASLVRFLFAQNVNIRQTTLKEDSVMHFACRYKCLDAVTLLLGVDKDMVFERNRKGKTPRNEAELRGNIEVLKKMRDVGIQVEIRVPCSIDDSFGYLNYTLKKWNRFSFVDNLLLTF